MKAPINSRYAHCDGITDIKLFGWKIVTCGSDGDIRIWKNPEDPDPFVFSASDGCLSLVCTSDAAYVGTENNCVEVFQLPSGNAEKSIAKFTAAVNHVDISKSGKFLVAGSGDMTIQILKLKDTSSPPIKIEGHTAPVLSVLIDPKEEFVVSTGCDGCVVIWTLESGKQVKSWDGVFKSSNDILTSKTLCRPSWDASGKMLAVPKEGEILIYSRNGWNQEKLLKGPSNKILSVTAFSSCGKYLGAGSTDGMLLVWSIEDSKLIYENSETKDHITGLTWSSSGKDIYAADIKGRIVFVNDCLSSHNTQDLDELEDELDEEERKPTEKNTEDDPFDDDMNEFLVDDESNDNEISISNIKALAGFKDGAGDKEGDVWVGVDKAKKIAGIVKQSVEEIAELEGKLDINLEAKILSRPPEPIKIPFTDPQAPFQPASSPEHLSHRFMVWNSIGIIRNYEMDEDEADAIDIEFHDVSFHNGIHLRNQHDYTIAALGKEAVIFSAPKRKGVPSKIMVLHYSTWDSSKEWSIELPKNEEVTTAAIGSGWFAVGTSLNRLRIFTVGGVQRNVIDVGGQIIALSGHEDLLFVTFHTGIGLHGNQSISYSLLRIRGGTGLFPLISSEALPLSPKSEITWVGFSDEGTPSFSDSTDTVRLLNGRLWMTFLSIEAKNESDHYWVTGVSVCSQHVRAIKCKGTRYPPTLPRPTILLLDAKLPLCEMQEEKSQMEDILLRSLMLTALTKKMDKKGFDVEEYKEQADKGVKENLMKLFANSCKENKDFRASEYVSMMPTTHSIQVAIKYANKLRKMALTDRLTAIGRRKLDEEDEGLEEDDDDFENIRSGNVIYSSVYSTFGNNATNMGSGDTFDCSSINTTANNQSSSEVMFLEENPLLTRQRAEIQSIFTPSSTKKNPFKKNDDTEPSTSSIALDSSSKFDDSGKGLALIDAWKKPAEKQTMEFNPKHPKSKASTKKTTAAGEKRNKGAAEKDKASGKKQRTLFAMTGPKSVEPKSPATVDENSMPEEAVTNGNNEKKRKRSVDDAAEADVEEDTEKKSRISSKLSMFRRNDGVNNDEELGDI